MKMYYLDVGIVMNMEIFLKNMLLLQTIYQQINQLIKRKRVLKNSPKEEEFQTLGSQKLWSETPDLEIGFLLSPLQSRPPCKNIIS